MSATLPTNFVANHAPTAAEMGQIINAITRITNWGVSFTAGGGSLSSSSLTYVDVTGTSMTWTKNGDAASSDIFCLLLTSCYVDTLNVQPMFGVHIGSSDYDVVEMTFNTTSTHQFMAGFRTITGVAAGVYSPNVRFKRNTANTGTTHIDAGDTVSLLLVELPK